MEVFRSASLEDLTEENEILREELLVLCERLTNIEERKADQPSELACRPSVDVAMELGEKTAELTKLRLEIQQLKGTVSMLEELREESHETALRLNRELLDCVCYRSRSASMEKKWKESMSQNDGLREVNSAHLESIKLQEARYAKLETQVLNLQGALTTLQTENKQLQEQLDGCRDQVLTLKDTASRNAAEYEAGQEELATQQQAMLLMQAETKQLQQRCQSQSREIQRLTEQLLERHHTSISWVTTAQSLWESPPVSPQKRRQPTRTSLDPISPRGAGNAAARPRLAREDWFCGSGF